MDYLGFITSAMGLFILVFYVVNATTHNKMMGVIISLILTPAALAIISAFIEVARQ